MCPATGEPNAVKTLALIPAYNESASIGKVIEATRAYLPDLLVVDDGSQDNTAEVARAAGAEVLVQNPNQGKGAALQAGMDYAVGAGYDAVVTLDADGQHDPAVIPGLLAPLEQGRARISVGSRMGEWNQKMPLIRRLTNGFMSWFLSKICGQKMEDTQSGFRAIHADVMRSIRLQGRRFDAESEFLIKAARQGHPIAWVPMPTIYGGRPSHINPIRDSLRWIRMLYRVLRPSKD